MVRACSTTQLISDAIASLEFSGAFLVDRQRAAPDAAPAPFDSDVSYFSKRAWSNCGGC
jgi:hypothetical protein